jgi:hypothetical protein
MDISLLSLTAMCTSTELSSEFLKFLLFYFILFRQGLAM